MEIIIINGKPIEVDQRTITYQEICDLAGVPYKEGMYPSMTYQIKGPRAQSGILTPDKYLDIQDAVQVVINVAHTNNA